MSVDGLVKKDVKTGFLPIEPYRNVDECIQTYASDIFMNQCLSETGRSITVVPFDWNDPAAAQFSRESISEAFTVENAQLNGYHRQDSENGKRMREAQAEITEHVRDPEWAAAWDGCFKKMRQSEPFVSETEIGEAPGFYPEGVEELPEVRGAAVKWRECMSPLGIPDLPETPSPAFSVIDRFGLGITDGADAAIFAIDVDPEEKAIAVEDAKCRASSEYDQILYDAYWVGPEKVLAANPGEFTARREAIEKQNQAYKDYIQNEDARQY
jgi:hypothetical protein